jgi:hypothetical protein
MRRLLLDSRVVELTKACHPIFVILLAPLPVAPVNEADTVLLPEGLKALKRSH